MKRRSKKKNDNNLPLKQKVKWYALVGYNVDDDTQSGFLAIDKTRKNGCYHVVKDRSQALKFPSENIYNVEGFGTPKQWLEFFKGEDELSNWEFHLAKTSSPQTIV